MAELIWVAVLELEGSGSSFTVPEEDLMSVLGEIKAALADGEERTYRLKIEQMTREHLDSLPEFDGF